jgi:DNA-binding FadR family transcriptional regulator
MVTSPTPKVLTDQLAGLVGRMASTGQGQEHMEQARVLFEAGVAWQAAAQASDEDIKRLRKAVEANAAALGNTAEFVRTDVAFHYEITVITRNPIFIAVNDILVEWLIDQRTTTIHMPDADRYSVRDHTAIYEAVAARDPLRAFREMTTHLRLISQLYKESKRLSEAILREVSRDVAERIDKEMQEMWSVPAARNANGAAAAPAKASKQKRGARRA